MYEIKITFDAVILYSSVHYNTELYKMVQYGKVQDSTVQCSTIRILIPWTSSFLLILFL